jgi:hypothetical protein
MHRTSPCSFLKSLSAQDIGLGMLPILSLVAKLRPSDGMANVRNGLDVRHLLAAVASGCSSPPRRPERCGSGS